MMRAVGVLLLVTATVLGFFAGFAVARSPVPGIAHKIADTYPRGPGLMLASAFFILFGIIAQMERRRTSGDDVVQENFLIRGMHTAADFFALSVFLCFAFVMMSLIGAHVGDRRHAGVFFLCTCAQTIVSVTLLIIAAKRDWEYSRSSIVICTIALALAATTEVVLFCMGL